MSKGQETIPMTLEQIQAMVADGIAKALASDPVETPEVKQVSKETEKKVSAKLGKAKAKKLYPETLAKGSANRATKSVETLLWMDAKVAEVCPSETKCKAYSETVNQYAKKENPEQWIDTKDSYVTQYKNFKAFNSCLCNVRKVTYTS